MTETDELKAATDKSKAQQQIKDVEVYLSSIFDRLGTALGREFDAEIIYFIAWIALLISDFLAPQWAGLFGLIFFLSFVYLALRRSDVARLQGELDGAFTILIKLGLTRPDSMSGASRRKRRTWEEGADIVKSWFARKKEMQKKVYAPT